MVKDTKAAVIIITIVSILAFMIAAVCGTLSIGDEISDQILPTSLTTSDDTIKPITEKNFTPTVISIKQPKPKVQKNYTKTNNTTVNNTTSNTENTSVEYNNHPTTNNYNTQDEEEG